MCSSEWMSVCLSWRVLQPRLQRVCQLQKMVSSDSVKQHAGSADRFKKGAFEEDTTRIGKEALCIGVEELKRYPSTLHSSTYAVLWMGCTHRSRCHINIDRTDIFITKYFLPQPEIMHPIHGLYDIVQDDVSNEPSQLTSPQQLRDPSTDFHETWNI